MQYKIDEQADGLDISLGVARNEQEKLLEAFQECQQGRCSCPTDEYKKLDSLDIVQDGAGIQLRLKSRGGEAFDKSEIEKCLAYTAGQVQRNK